MNTRLSILILLLAPLLLASCSEPPPNLDERLVTALTAPEVIGDWLIQGRNDFMVFDLRQEAQFNAGHVPKAVWMDPERLSDPGTLRAFPDYKKLVFYDAAGEISAELMRPLLQRGLTVLVMRGGYEGWERDVLTEPGAVRSEQDSQRVAMSRYFRGESVTGTPQPLKDIPAGKYIRPAELPPIQLGPVPASEGC